MARFLQILAVLAVGLTAACVSGQFSVRVELDKERANLGDTLTVRCEVQNEKGGRFTMVWIKKVGEDEVQIGTNSYLNVPFEKTKRFTLEHFVDAEKGMKEVSFMLTIRDLHASDSGEVGCRIEEERIEVLKGFTVMVPISMIKLNSQDENGTHAVTYVNEQEVTFDEGEVRRMRCYVNGSYPEPDVKMLMGDEDITELFEREVRLAKEDPYTGLRPLTYEVKMSSEAFPILYSYSGEMLRCVASVPDTPFSEESVGITIKLAGYKPKFLCEQTQLTGVHQRNVNISCRVRADPPVEAYKFHWDKMSDGNASLIAGEQSGHYKAEVLPGQTEFESTMVLFIDRVFIQHFREYYFEAVNDLGRVKHIIQLQRDRNIEKLLLQEESVKEEKANRPDPQTGSSTAGADKPVVTGSLLAGMVLLLVL